MSLLTVAPSRQIPTFALPYLLRCISEKASSHRWNDDICSPTSADQAHAKPFRRGAEGKPRSGLQRFASPLRRQAVPELVTHAYLEEIESAR